MSQSDGNPPPSVRTEFRVAGALVGVWFAGALALLAVDFDSRKRTPHFAAGLDSHGVRVPNPLRGFKPEIREVNEYDRIEADEDGWVNLDGRNSQLADQDLNECFDLGAVRHSDSKHANYQARIRVTWNTDPLSKFVLLPVL